MQTKKKPSIQNYFQHMRCFDQSARKLTKHVEYIMLYYIATTTQRLIKYS